MTTDLGFQVAVPTLTTNVKQGEVQNVTLALHRGNYFKQDVRLELKTTAGLSIDPSNILVKASDAPDVQFRIAAAKDAALSDYRVDVTATPGTGQPRAGQPQTAPGGGPLRVSARPTDSQLDLNRPGADLLLIQGRGYLKDGRLVSWR